MSFANEWMRQDDRVDCPTKTSAKWDGNWKKNANVIGINRPVNFGEQTLVTLPCDRSSALLTFVAKAHALSFMSRSSFDFQIGCVFGSRGERRKDVTELNCHHPQSKFLKHRFFILQLICNLQARKRVSRAAGGVVEDFNRLTIDFHPSVVGSSGSETVGDWLNNSLNESCRFPQSGTKLS